METIKKITPQERIALIKKAIEKKRAIDLYFRGKLSISELNALGIKSALPV
jgi:hypothetical protein